MSIPNKKYSPQKNTKQTQQTINPQYLNFIRKNHLKFELQQKFNQRILLQSDQKIHNQKSTNDFQDWDDFKKVNSVRKLPTGMIEEDHQRVLKKINDLSPDEKQLIKNYRTIDVLPQNSYQKYLNLGQMAIITKKRQNNNNNQSQNEFSEKNLLSSRLKSSIHELKKQIAYKLLQDDQNKKDQQFLPYNSRHFSTQTLKINQKKAISQVKFIKANNNNDQQNRSPLLMKKPKTRDLWKQKFLNWNYGSQSQQYKKIDKKDIQRDIKFPSINITKMLNKDRAKSNTQQIKSKKINEVELDNCNLIRNSKPKLKKQQDTQAYLQNKSIPVYTRTQEEVENFIKKHIESGLLRQNSNRNHQYASNKKRQNNNHSQLSTSMLHSNPSSVSIMKRKRITTHLTSGMTQITQSSTMRQHMKEIQSLNQNKKKPKNYKQIARQKQKQVENYLLNNSLMKSSKIVNYYEKQQQKNKVLFDQKHKNQFSIVRQPSISLIDRKSANKKRNINDIVLQSKQIKSQNDLQNDVQATQNLYGSILESSLGVSPQNLQKKKSPNINLLRKDYDLSIYELKIRSYREFIFMMNLAHKVVINIGLKPASQAKGLPKFTYFIGNGNNRLLIKSLINRRYWWQETRDMHKANFVWTQLKVNELYRHEKVSQYARQENMFDKFQVIGNTKKQVKKKNTLKSQTKVTSYKAPLPQNSELKVFTNSDQQIYDSMMENISDNPDNIININLSNRLKFLPIDTLKINFTEQTLHQQKLHNHLEFNYFIGNKKALFYNLQNYYNLLGKDVFKIIPYTLHIKKGVQDSAYKTFLKEYKKIAKDQESTGMKNIWIVKPGQLSNRGQGITVIDQVYELNNILKKKEKHKNGIQKSYILQKYIQKPLLYKNRKFDIRHYVLLTRFHGRFRAYFYGEGYIRTSSQQYKLDQLDEMIHLTNDAIQNKGQSYGKHEDGNKVSYSQFQRYLDSTYGENKHNFAEDIYPKMKSIALDAIKATYSQLDPNRLEHNFQLLGLDFMIDNKFNLWLIEVNTNPCLELSSKLLERLIPQMAEHTLRLCIDPMFPPPAHFPNSLKHMCPDSPLERMQYELIFDQARDGKQLQQLFKKCNLKQLYKDMGEVDQQDATFENDGKQIQLKNQKGQDNE